MPKHKYNLRTRNTGRTSTPSTPTSSSRGFSISGIKKELKRRRDTRNFRASARLKLGPTGICDINTGRMATRSQLEIYNYAFLINAYIKRQRGQKTKIKSTKSRRREQATLCSAVRGVCQNLFGNLNKGKTAKHKLFSVVAHTPDQCLVVESFGNRFNQVCPTGMSGVGLAPGWLPMTNQANGLVSKVGLQTLNSSGQTSGPYLTLMKVDGLVPTGLLPIDAWTKANGGTDPLGAESDEEEDSDSD